MSVFPKDILLKILHIAIQNKCISALDARLVCKAARDDARIDKIYRLYRLYAYAPKVATYFDPVVKNYKTYK